MRLAHPEDRFYRLELSTEPPARGRDVPPSLVLKTGEMELMNEFNEDVAAYAKTDVRDLPIMPVASVFAGPLYLRFALSPAHHGLTLGCPDVLGLIKGVAREMGISNNYIPKRSRFPQEALCLN